QVGFRHEHCVPPSPREHLPHLHQILWTVAECGASWPFRGDHKRQRIYTEPAYPQLQPGLDDLLDLRTYFRISRVQIRLVIVESVIVVFTRYFIECPRSLLYARKYHSLFGVRWLRL